MCGSHKRDRDANAKDRSNLSNGLIHARANGETIRGKTADRRSGQGRQHEANPDTRRGDDR
jgi:hypothetical protein